MKNYKVIANEIGLQVLVTADGQKSKPYDRIGEFVNGLAEVRIETFSAATHYYSIFLYGYIDENGNEVVPVEYNRVVHEFGMITATKYDENGKIQLDMFYEKDLISDKKL